MDTGSDRRSTGPELDLDALHGGFGSDVLRALMAHYEYRRGVDRERARDLAWRLYVDSASDPPFVEGEVFEVDCPHPNGDTT